MRNLCNSFCILLVLMLAGCQAKSPDATAISTSRPTPSVNAPNPTITPGDQPTATKTNSAAASSPTKTPLPQTDPPLTANLPPTISLSNVSALTQTLRMQYSPWDPVLDVAWAPGGDLLAVAAGEVIYLYTAGTYEESGRFQTGVWTASLDFHPHGQWIASGNYDGIIRVWQTGSYIPTFKFEAHPKGVNCIAFSPDGLTLASCGKDAVARLWEISNGDNTGQLIGGTYAIPAIAFTPDGANLAILNGDLIRIREIATQRFAHTIYGEGLYYSLAIDSTGEVIAAGNTENTVQIWDIKIESGSPAETRESRLTLSGHQGEPNRPSALIWDVIFSPDGNLLASAGGDSTIRLWDSHSGELLLTLDDHTNAVTSLAFSPSGSSLASGSLDGSVILWGIEEQVED